MCGLSDLQSISRPGDMIIMTEPSNSNIITKIYEQSDCFQSRLYSELHDMLENGNHLMQSAAFPLKRTFLQSASVVQLFAWNQHRNQKSTERSRQISRHICQHRDGKCTGYTPRAHFPLVYRYWCKEFHYSLLWERENHLFQRAIIFFGMVLHGPSYHLNNAQWYCRRVFGTDLPRMYASARGPFALQTPLPTSSSPSKYLWSSIFS